MSEFAWRKATSVLSYLGGSAAPMVTLAPEPSAPELPELREILFVAAASWENNCFFFLVLSRGSWSSYAGKAMAAVL